VWKQFCCWRDSGVWHLIMARLLRRCRGEAGRDPEPSVALLDAHSVPSGHLGPREEVGIGIGIDGGKRVRGRKRHLLCDINGLPIAIGVSSAQPHDSRGRLDLARNGDPAAHPAHQGVRRRRLHRPRQTRGCGTRRHHRTSGDVPRGPHWFVPLQPLWRVERTFAWLGRNRRLRHDYEATVTSSQTFAHAAAVAFMLNRLYPTR
jgi:putative transposase